MSQTSDETEDSLLDTNVLLADECALQIITSKVVPNAYVPQSMDSRALLCLLFENCQRELKTMHCLKEIKRSFFSSLLLQSRNAI